MLQGSHYNRAATVTPSDANNFTQDQMGFAALFVGGAGNVVVVWPDDTTTTFTGLLAGVIYTIRGFKRINATNTTATNMLLLFSI